MSSLITNCDLDRPTTSSQNAELDDADEEEVLIEPRFKYSRTLNDVSKVLLNDSPSCIAIHDKFIAMGCQSGRIFLFDHLGNGHMECTARHHKCAVSCISIDKPGNYFVSCANDFTVSIFGIGSNEYNQASEMQNKRIHLRLLRERIERTRKRIRALHFRLTDVTEEDVQREKRAKEMEQNIAIMEDETTALNHTTSEMRSTYTPLRNELVLRRRFAINELRRIFFPSEIDMSDQETTFFNGTKRTCSCKRLDTIRANHLPVHLQSSKDAKFVHTDFEISASAGYLLHLIECFCRILHLPTKYMPFVMGSRSHFLDRSNLDLYNLFPGISPKRKKSRGYVSAVYFLDRSLPILADTVVQLRADCGLFTRERDRPVRNMLEIMVLCVGRNLSTSSPNSPVEMEPLNPFSAMSSTFF